VRVGRGAGGGGGGGVVPNMRWISRLRNCQILFSICGVGMGGIFYFSLFCWPLVNIEETGFFPNLSMIANIFRKNPVSGHSCVSPLNVIASS